MASEQSGPFGVIFRTLKSRNYRLFFAGQGVSLIGTWMQQVALSWLVYRLTDSVFLLGVVGFAGQFPTFVISPFAGVLSDRWNRHRTLILTQALSMAQALTLAVLVLTGTVAVWHIIVLSLFLGCVNALDIPTRQSFVIHMIDDKRDLGNAIALNSAMFNGARFLGPSVAGGLYLASRTSVLGLGRIIPLSSGIFGMGLIGFAFSRTLWLSLFLMLVIGIGIMIHVASCNTMLQTLVEDGKRGRVMSFFAVAFLGMAPLGSLMAGSVAQAIGITGTMAIGGIFCIAGAVFFTGKLSLLRSIVRPIYAEKGIAGPS